jgi:hypothetical protein
MKTRSRKTHAIRIPSSRWLAYASAGAATALAGAASTKAEIHYSGRIDATFRHDDEKTEMFPLDQPGDFIAFEHDLSGQGLGQVYFQVHGLANAGFAGTYLGFEYASVSRLTGVGRYVSQAHFVAYEFGTMVKGNPGFYLLGQWKERGTAYVGFRFNSGAGFQYGWARVHMAGKNENFAFKVLDYAYADLGEPIKTGQRSSSLVDAPNESSLGLLALGAAGVALWRQRGRQTVPQQR